MDQLNNPIVFTLFYDGLCPICRREVAWLHKLDKHRRLGLQDINQVDFQPMAYGKTHAELLATIHGVYPDGRMLQGMAVFRAAYQAAGWGWLLAPTGWPLLKPGFDGLYWVFAKYRLRLARLVANRESCNCGKNTDTSNQ